MGLPAWAGMLLLWGALFGLLTGLGTWVMRRVGVDAPDNAPTALLYLSRFWVGYAPCIALLQLVHLVTPINALVTAAVLCLCAVVSLSRAVEAWRRRAAHAEATPRWVCGHGSARCSVSRSGWRTAPCRPNWTSTRASIT